jgi:hypothetical protein
MTQKPSERNGEMERNVKDRKKIMNITGLKIAVDGANIMAEKRRRAFREACNYDSLKVKTTSTEIYQVNGEDNSISGVYLCIETLRRQLDRRFGWAHCCYVYDGRLVSYCFSAITRRLNGCFVSFFLQFTW